MGTGTGRKDPAVPAAAGLGTGVVQTKLVEFERNDVVQAVFGEHGSHLTLIEKLIGVEVHARGNQVTIVGSEGRVAVARRVLDELYEVATRGHLIGPRDVEQAVSDLGESRDLRLFSIHGKTILVSSRGRSIRPKGLAQKRYVEAISHRDMVFAIGPAGTGKTYLAMAMAVRAFQDRAVKRIILARPAVEAGEKLGFLPGSMLEKVNPYLRPLYDALNDMIEPARVRELVDKGVIEVAPLAFMRGRTLNDSFVVLDEAQNSTSEQMKMFLTRLGYNSKAVINGDITQTDLPAGRGSGLVEALDILAGIEGIVFCSFTDKDVVRHPLVQRVIKAYEKWESKRRQGPRRDGDE
ncbi:MAG: PhoH family protein [Deltaproteobacteria bacterium]|nr:PhoH family protein [Deltaproteobacteria bacterium]